MEWISVRAALVAGAAAAFLAACTVENNDVSVEEGLGAARSVVGNAIYVIDADLTQPIGEGRGKTVFAALESDGCVAEDSDYSGDSNGEVHVWSSSSDFYEYIASDTRIDASLANAAVMKTSLSAAASRTVTRESKTAGSAYEFYAFKKRMTLSDACQTGRGGKGRLAADLMASFRKLPFPVAPTDEAASWRPYQEFLRTYGSHVVTDLKTGARFLRYTFLRSSQEVTETQLKVAACAAAEGQTSAGKVSVDGCQGIDEKQRRSVNLSDFTTRTSAYGGNPAVRDELTGGEPITPALLARFADTQGTPQDGVSYSLTPVWDLLLARATSARERNVANSLKAYFEGFIAANCNQIHGCGCSKVLDAKRKVTLRRFVQTAADPVKYECQRPATGCRRDEDCHYNAGKAYCQCYGDHCVNVGTDGVSAIVNYTGKITGKNTGPNRSCHLRATFTCHCTRPESGMFWNTIWSGGS